MSKGYPVCIGIGVAVLVIASFFSSGCQSQPRQTPLESGQRADNQQNITVNAQGINYFPVYEKGMNPPSTQPAMTLKDLNAQDSSQTSTGSVQGSTEQTSDQRGDASGQTDQGMEGDADLDVTPSP